ncbi:MAG: winged helix-turn-helix domain-containing protein [Pyrinomonadaceae bacterium]
MEAASAQLVFGDFRFDPNSKSLWREEEFIPLAPKALELLALLIEKRGELASKNEIFERVWSDSFVEDGVLTQNIYILRQALGNDLEGKPLIENVARRGYRIRVPITDAVAATTFDDVAEPIAAPKLNGSNGHGGPKYSLPVKSRRKWLWLVPILLIPILLASGYFLLRRQIWSYFHPPFENVVFEAVTDTGNVLDLAVSPGGDFAVFSRSKKLVLRDLKAGKDLDLNIPEFEKFGKLQFSGDGNSIYFRDNQIAVQNADIYSVSRFGGKPALLAENTIIGFGVSSDGKSIAFARAGKDSKGHQIVIKDLRTGAEKVLLTRAFPETLYRKSSISWSPDGTKLAFVTHSGTDRATKLVIAETADGSQTDFANPRLQRFEYAAWLPDGETLLAAAAEPTGGVQLWKIWHQSGNIQRVSNGLESYDKLSVSKDGKTILARRTNDFSNVWTVDPSDPLNAKRVTRGSSSKAGQTSLSWIDDDDLVFADVDVKTRLSHLIKYDGKTGKTDSLTKPTDFHSDFASVSPDKSMIAYNTNRDRLVTINRIRPDGGGLEELQSGGSGLRLFPVWAHDGKSLFYIFRTRDEASIRQLDLASKKESVFFSDSSVTPAAFMEISPNGEYLGFLDMKRSEIDGEASEGFKFAILRIADKSIQRFYVKTNSPKLAFAPDGSGFDVIEAGEGDVNIVRQDFDGASERKKIFSVAGERIFNLAWSPDGKRLALARGVTQQDAVILRNFE